MTNRDNEKLVRASIVLLKAFVRGATQFVAGLTQAIKLLEGK